MSGFGDRDAPLVAGSMYGLRSFNISATGQLHPLHRLTSFTYEPGENVARCDQESHGFGVSIDPKIIPSKQTVPSKHCSCGFYAYFKHKLGSGEIVVNAPGRVLAAVEGYGKCLVGSEGFRSEKLKIVGLVLDPAPSDLAPEPAAADTKLPFSAKFFEFCVKAGNGFKYLWKHRIILVFSIAQALLTLAAVSRGSSYVTGVLQLLLLLFFFFAVIMATLGIVGDYGTFVNAYFEAEEAGDNKQSPAIRQAIRHRFPDVPFYETPEDLLNAIPITNAEDIPAV